MWALFILVPFWWVFTAPGRFTLWRNYMFPGHGVGPWYSARQSDSTAVLIILSLQFWIMWGGAAFVLSGVVNMALQAVISGPNGTIGIPPFWINFYYNLDSWQIVRYSETFDLNTWHWFMTLPQTLFGSGVHWRTE